MSDYRIVLRAYPPSYRRENGPEITDTVNELTGERWSIRQFASLAVGGLRTRTRHATRGSSRTAWESGARVGLFVWLLGLSAYFFAAAVFRTYYYGSSTLDWLLPLAAVLAMTISTRWWVAVLVTAIWVVPLWEYATNWVIQSASFVETAMTLPWTAAVVLAWWIALATDGRRATSPAVGISLIVGATVAVPILADSALAGWMPVYVFLVLVLGGLVISSVDPRMAATGAVYAGLLLSSLLLLMTFRPPLRWESSWTAVIVLSVAVALTAAASQLGMRRLARM